MQCAECEAFEAAYRMAKEHYASIAASLLKTQGVKTSEYRKLKLQAELAGGSV